MNITVIYLTFLCMLCALSGCAGKQKIEQDVAPEALAPFASGAITVRLNAQPDLNLVNGMANSCTILVLQAEKSQTLEKVLSNPVKVKALFAGTGVETDNGDTVLQVDRYIMMPGQFTTLHIDRAMDTRHVTVIAGYYPFPGKQHRIHAAIPVNRFQTGWWKTVWHSELSPLFLGITLGKHGIVSVMDAPEQSEPDTLRSSERHLPETSDNG